ncbi:MAG: hypothetical protein H0V13_07745 [Nocardioidaceae bacterium]|nr:hypothetical protein [Nocardioidaceae bacterium]MBA3991428.1 hypothetical protein [Propionibacteriales bacterium]
MDAREYAARVASYVPPATPTLAPLLQAAEDLDAAIAAADAQIDAARQQFQQAFDNIRAALKQAILDAVPLEEIRGALGELTVERSLKLEATLGPLYVAATSPPVQLRDPRDGSLITLGPLPPDAFTARLDAGPLRGGGTLVHLPDGVSGLLTANVGVAEVAALASIRKLGNGPSFLAVLSAGFTPGLQVGFGFQINRVGGVIGIERRLDADILARRLGDGSATAVLFPLDIAKNGRAVLDAAEGLFPPEPGSAVAGPTFRFAWLEVAGKGFASVDLGVLLELPGPRKIALVGVLKAGIDPVVRLRADFAGVIDFAQQRATVDATLVDSGALGIFRIYGDLAFASSWGPASYTVLSLGGFYPGFRPEPAQIRPLSRLGMAPEVALPGFRMRAEGYLAATSNTLQIGGRLDVGVDAGIASISGFLGVDALVQFTPFHINAQIAAGLDVRFLGQTFCGVSFHGTLDGPGPVTLAGRLSVETFFKDFDFDKTFVIGSPAPREEISDSRALEAVRLQAVPDNLTALGGADRLVTLAPLDRTGKYAVVAPLGGVEWRQHAVPLDTPIDRVAGVPVGSVQTVTARATQPQLTSQQVKDRFAPGSFITLTAAESLNGPTYDELPAGLQLHGATVPGAKQPRGPAVTVLRKVRGEEELTSGPAQGTLLFAGALLAMVAERDRAAAVHSSQVAVDVAPSRWVTTGGGSHDSATQAMQAARLGGGVALAAADAARPVTLEGF